MHKYELQYFVLNTVSSFFSSVLYLVYNEFFTFDMHVRVPTIRTPTVIDIFDTVLFMYVAVLLVFDRILYRPGEGRMRPNGVSTKLI